MKTKITLLIESSDTSSNSDWRNQGRYLDRIAKGIDGVKVLSYTVGEPDPPIGVSDASS